LNTWYTLTECILSINDTNHIEKGDLMNSKINLEKYPSTIMKAFTLLLFATLVKTSIEVAIGLLGAVYVGISASVTGVEFDTILLNITDMLNLIGVAIADLFMISILISFTKKRRWTVPHFKESLQQMPSLKVTLFACFGLFSVAMIGGLFTQYISALFQAETPEHIEAMMDVGGIFTAEFLLTVITVVIIAPLFEEFLLRKLMMDGLLRSFSPKVAIAVSALFFAVFHMNFVQGAYTLILGLYLGYLYYKTGSYRLVVIVHAINNLYAVSVRQMPESWYGAIGILMIIVGIPSFIYVLMQLKTEHVQWAEPELNEIENEEVILDNSSSLYQDS